MDTWATSSLTPQIAGRMGADEALYGQVFPFSVRPLAHEIIRSWAFYSLVRARHHFDQLLWKQWLCRGGVCLDWGRVHERTQRENPRVVRRVPPCE